MQEANGSNDILDVIIARTNGNEFGEEDDVIHRGWENTDSKENGEEEPLLDVADNIARRVLSVVEGCGLLAVLPKLVQT